MVSISGSSRKPTPSSVEIPGKALLAAKKAGEKMAVTGTITPVRPGRVELANPAKAKLLATPSAANVGSTTALGNASQLAQTGAAVALKPYPSVPRGDHIDEYFGTKVADPYRALEDDAKAAAVFDAEQNAYSHDHLSKLPARSAFVDYLTRLYNSPDNGSPRKVGDNTFFTQRLAGEEQPSLYVRAAADGSVRRLFNPVDDDPTATLAIGGYSVATDGKQVALGLSDNGSDWVTWYIQDPATGQRLADTIRWTKTASVEWLPDGSGFYYAGLPKPAEGRELLEAVHDMVIRFHRVGTDQSEDTTVFATPERPTLTHDITVDKDAKLEIVQSADLLSGEMSISVRPLGDMKAPFTKVFSTSDADYQITDVIDATHLRLQTDSNAPNGKIIELDIGSQPPVVKEVLPQDPEAVLQSARFIGERVYANYLLNGSSLLRVYHNGQIERTIPMPDRGTVSSFWGNEEGTQVHYSFQNMYIAPTEFVVDTTTGKRSISKPADINVDSASYITEEEFVKSSDGTLVPMWVTRRRDTQRDGETPTLLYAYGGFDVDITPTYSRRFQTWLDAGGIVAVPQLRGGGELGENWHKMGQLGRKQNVFEDFKAAARHLTEQKFTNASKLTIAGDSNGGYLMGAMLTQAPELFACVLAGVGVQDQLRYPLYTWGPGWVPEYGDAANDPAAFKNLIGLSPVHNVRKGVHFPTTLITTGSSDDRVAPMHSRKFAAALQWASGGDKPILFRIDQDTGHGAGRPVTKAINLTADQFALAFDAMGCNDYVARLTAVA